MLRVVAWGVLALPLPALAVNLQVNQLDDSASDPSPAGSVVTYDVIIENSASDIASNTFTLFDLPAGTTAVNLPAFCQADAAVPTRIACNHGSVVGTGGSAGGSPVSFQLQVDTQGLGPGNIAVTSAVGRAPVPPATTPLASLPPSDPFFAGDTNTADNLATQTTTLTESGDLALTKTATPDPVVAGAEVTYTISVVNNGPSVSTNFNVADTLPAGTAFVAGSASGTGWSFSGANGTYSGSLGVGATASYTFRARVTAASGTLVNSATVNALGTPDPVADNNTDSASVNVAAGADLSMQKTATPTPALPGQPITFTLTVTNNGPSPAAGVSFSDTMPAGFLITAGSTPAGWNCATTGGDTVRSCSLGSGTLAVGASQDFTITATVPATGTGSSGNQVNTATVTASTPDPVPANNSGTVNFTVLPDGADLSLGKSKTPGVVAVWPGPGTPAENSGYVMTSAINVANIGPRPATGGVQVVDQMAPGEEYFPTATAPWTCTATAYAPPPARQQVTCSLDASALPLAMGANAPPLQLKSFAHAEADTSVALTNTACTGGTGGSLEPTTDGGLGDQNDINDCNGAGVRPSPLRADLGLSKQTNGAGEADNTLPVGYGSASPALLTYTLTVTNAGPDATVGVVVQDPIPGFIAGVTSTVMSVPAGWGCVVSASGTLTCNSGGTSVPVGTQTIAVTVAGALADSAGRPAGACGAVTAPAGSWCNTAGIGIDASVPGAAGEINPGNNSASDYVRVPRVANVQTVSKTIPTGSTGREGVITDYLITYRNQGPSSAPGVIFRDVITLPANDGGFVLLSAVRNGGGTTACAVAPGPGVNTVPAAGGTSYNTLGNGSGTVAVTCTALDMANQQSNTLTVRIRPNLQAGGSSGGRQFSNVADFSFSGDADGRGSDALGDYDYNSVATAADDQKDATLVFNDSQVDLIANKVDLGFAGGVDPLGYDPASPASNLITYRIRVNNLGPSVATATHVVDTIAPPAGRTLSFVGVSTTPGGAYSPAGCTITAGSSPATGAPMTIDCPMPGAGFASNVQGVINANATATLYLRYEYQSQPAAGGDTVANSVTADSDETDTNPGNDTEGETTSIRSSADLAVAKRAVAATPAPSDNPGTPLPDAVSSVSIRQPFFYVFEGVNNGPGSSLSLDRGGSNPLNGTGTVLTDTLPAGLVVTGPISWRKAGPAIGGDEVPNGTGSCTQAGSTVTCNVGDVTTTSGEQGRVRVIVPARWDAVPSGGTVDNTATVATEQVDKVPGNNTVTVPLGVVSASLEGVVFEDRDRSAGNGGIRQSAAAEPGIGGVTLTLTGTDAYGNPVNRTTTTAADGSYRFDTLSPADASGYTLTQAQPATYANGPIDPPAAGADAPSLGGSYAAGSPNSAYTAIAVGAGQVGVRYNFPEVRRPSLSGFVYADNNFNNVRDAEVDPAIAGAAVELLNASTGAVIATTSTDADGAYRFDDLDPGIVYTLREALPAGPYSNRPAAVNPGLIDGTPCAGGCTPGTGVSGDAVTTDRISQIDLGTGANGTEFNFGEAVSGSALQGRVWLDADNDGVIDSGEAGIGDVTLALTGTDQNGDAVNRTVTTNPDGSYAFLGLLPGTYTVTEPTQPPATLNGTTVAGSTGGTATPVGTVPSAIAAVALGINQVSLENNFGEIPVGSIGGRIYFDNNRNGAIDGDETGIPGVTVTLTGTDDLGQPVDVTVSTDAEGRYSFPNLRPGTYTVTEPTQPPGTTDGITMPGAINGVPSGTATPPGTTPSAISTIALPPGGTSLENNFGEVADSPDLAVSKEAAPAKFTVNNVGAYTIRVRNIGPKATVGEYAVDDRLPPGLTLAATPTGNGWTCAGAAGDVRFRCTSSATIASGATLADTIHAQVMVGSAAAAASPVNNAVLVQGGGEDAAHRPTPAEQAAFDGDVANLPVCDPAITQNACRLPTPVQLAASVSGTVWFDIGGDDTLLDGGDSRLSGWIVEVVDPASGQVARTTTTAADGSYRVPDLIPGVQWNIRFRDPVSHVLWGLPVGGETASGPVAACNTDAAIEAGTASTCRSSSDGVTQLEVVLTPGENLPQQSLPVDPSGVVYDAVTRDPVPGSVVTLTPAGVCAGYDPATAILNAGAGGYTIEGSAISMTVGQNGFYQFLFGPAAPARCEFALTVTPPAGYTFRSTLIPSEANALTPSGDAGSSHAVQPNATAPTTPVGTGTTYYLGLIVGSGTAGIIHNHIPLDPQVAPGLVITKTGDRKTVEVGDSMVYTITVRQTAGAALGTVNVIDRLPHGFTYIAGTARVDGAGIADPLGKPGPTLAFDVGALQVGAQKVLSYRVRVGVGAQQGDGINRARAHGCSIAGGCVDASTLAPYPNGVIASNPAEYRVVVSGGVFTDEGCVLGKVFVDCNVNHVQDHEELGIPGVRLYFEDGTWMVSDSEGKYSYCGLPPKSHTLKVDASTLPAGSRLTTSSNRNLGDADSLFIDLKNGELHRADFIEGSCSNPVLEQVKARRTQGEIRAPETETGHKPLRFESKPLRAPQQGTDPASQRPIVEPRPTAPGQDGRNPEAQP